MPEAVTDDSAADLILACAIGAACAVAVLLDATHPLRLTLVPA